MLMIRSKTRILILGFSLKLAAEVGLPQKTEQNFA